MTLEKLEELLTQFQRAKRLLTSKDKWYQGDFTSPDGTKFCVLGAMGYSKSSSVLDTTDVHTWCNYNLPVMSGKYSYGIGSEFNDAKTTTFKDIQNFLKEGIRLLKLQIEYKKEKANG